jgi:hypothetical protein
MWQANNKMVQIIEVNGLAITVNMDSTAFDAFVIPSGSNQLTPATLTPAGSKNLQFNNTNLGTPFKSLNNIGN